MPGYCSLRVSLPAAHAEFMTDLLSELGSIGSIVSGEDPVTIVAYFEGGDNLDAVERVLRTRVRDGGIPENAVAIGHGIVPQQDWQALWRQSLHPVRVGKRWLVRPSWLSSEICPNRTTLVIDPKIAFGTGTHATTQLCLVELEDLVKPGMSVLDVGTGTGILAIAAAKLGAYPVVGVEIDPEAAQCAKENLVLNGVAAHAEIVTGTFVGAGVGRGVWDLILANIEYRTILAMGRDMRQRVRPEGTAVFSGILHIEAQSFLAHLPPMGWQPVRLRRQFDPMTDDRWVCCVATASRGA